MLTYQDLLRVGETDNDRIDFVYRAIREHKSSDLYITAVIANDYDKHKNRTIMEFKKLIRNVMGELVPDEWTANYKLASRFFNRFVTQENQYLLGNGVTWGKNDTATKLGKDFDYKLQKLGKKALVGGVSYGFFNYDHLEAFGVDEFVPLEDENDGALKAGIRFWQIDDSKPLRATLYEIDGYTDYIWNKRDDKGEKSYVGEIMHDKRPYIEKITSTEADGEQIYDGENYPSFPIVPLWGNPYKQSELVGLREQIDCYDLIKSGYANTVDDASIIFWILNNAGGMDDVDLAQFIERIRNLHAVTTDDGVSATPHTMDAPYASREALLATLRADLYEDAMALDTKALASGGSVVTAVIKAAYEPLNSKTDEYEFCIREFLDGILDIAGIEDEPTFTRSCIINKSEEIADVLQAAQFLTQEYVTEKLLTIFGDADKVDDILKQLEADELERYNEQMEQLAMMQAGGQGNGTEGAQNEENEE